MHKNIIIVFWGHPLFDGRCMNMINQLLKSENEVHVIGVGDKSKIMHYKKATIQLMDMSLLNNPWTKYFKYFKYVKKAIKTRKVDVIIASDLYSMIPCTQIKSNHNAKIIYDSRELYTQLGGLKNKPLIQKIWAWYEKKYILITDYVLVTAEIDKDYLKKLYLHPNIEIIQNLPGDSFLNHQKNNLKEILCLNDEQKIFLYQGKFHRGRGIQFSIKCLTQISQAVLVLIGDGPMKSQYLKTAKQYNMEDRIFFMDAVAYENLGEFSSDAYIGLSVIQPISKSYEHALPNKLFEYAVSGVPVICSNLIAMKNMVAQYKNGIAIKPSDVNEFIKAYEEISKNYDNYILDEPTKSELLWNNKNKHLTELIDG
tara:strand:- start:236 stop:1342 length:1107 start_codon:yes stop_codon:yes gene_type:complete